jgi:hypothetical protein
MAEEQQSLPGIQPGAVDPAALPQLPQNDGQGRGSGLQDRLPMDPALPAALY